MEDRTATLKFISPLFCLICFLQLSGLKGMANYLSAALFLLIFFFLIFDREWDFSQNILWVILFLLFYTVSSIPNIDIKYYLKYLAYYTLTFSPVLLYSYFQKKYHQLYFRFVKSTLLPIFVIWFFMVYVSIVFYICNPDAARALASHEDTFEGTLIGGYQLSFGSSLLCVALWGCLIQKKFEAKLSVAVLVLCVSLCVLIYLTESTLTTFATIVGMVLSVIANITRNKNKTILLVFAAVAILGLSYFVLFLIEENLYAIMTWLDDRSSIRFFKRISEILNSVYYDNQTRHYAERLSLIAQSSNLFFSSPLIGHGYKYGNIFEAGKIYGIGNHSEIFDSLARYGLIGAAPLFILYYKNAKKILTRNIGVVVTFIMLVSFNPFISFAANLSFFFLIPMIYSVCDDFGLK